MRAKRHNIAWLHRWDKGGVANQVARKRFASTLRAARKRSKGHAQQIRAEVRAGVRGV